MLGDIAPIISLLHTARLHQQTPIRQNLAKHLLYQKSHSLNWFQRAPICMKKTNIGTQVPILATHFFPFRNFFHLYYSPLFIFTYPSLLLCPLRETSTSSPQFCFLSPKYKNQDSGMVGDFQFSKRALQKFKNSFLKRPKKGDFFSNKKVSIQKISHQNYDVIK